MTKSKSLSLHLITSNKEVEKKLIGLKEKSYLISNVTSNKNYAKGVGVISTTLKNKEGYLKILSLKEYEKKMTANMVIKKLIETKKASQSVMQKSYIMIIKACIKFLKKTNG